MNEKLKALYEKVSGDYALVTCVLLVGTMGTLEC